MKKIISLLLLLAAVANAYSQDPQTNLKKYWKMRERLKNFVVSGDCTGCGVPAISIERQEPGIPYLRYDDSGIRVGMYLSMLAMEWRLLYNSGQTSGPIIDAVTKELYYAIETINRLDRNAEDFWTGWNTNPNYTSDVLTLTPTNTGLNGFFIRDDVKDAPNFLYQSYNGKRIIDHLSSCQMPVDPRLVPKKIDSGFTTGIDQGIGPREESLDQVVNIYMGLALVKALIPDGINYNGVRFNNNSMSEPYDFVEAVKVIAERINNHMRDGGSWHIKNPASGVPGCVFGTCGAGDISNTGCLVGACGGGDVSLMSYGFDQVNCFIQGTSCDDFLYHTEVYLPNPQVMAATGIIGSIVAGIPGLGTLIAGLGAASSSSYVLWQTAYRWDNVPLISQLLEGDEDKVLTLAAIFNPWGTVPTHQNVAARGMSQKREFADLLSCVLHGQSPLLTNSYYECLLNDLECDGESPGALNWTVGDRFVYGQNAPYSNLCDNSATPCYGVTDGIADPTYLLDYLIYFNLYCLANPSYVGNSYEYIAPTSIAPFDIVLENVKEVTERNYIASQTIIARGANTPSVENDIENTYEIDDFGNVSFRAGQEIQLLPGFNTLNSGQLSASIDPTIEGFGCTNPSYLCSPVCTNTGDEEQLLSNNQNDVKTFNFSQTEMFATSGNTIFKLGRRGWVGNNMFELCNNGLIESCNVPIDQRSWIGHYHFASRIVDVKYIDDRTWIFTENGDVLKLLQTCHGYYHNPFGVIQNSSFDPDAFTATDNLSYDGDMRFKNQITAVEYVAPYLFIGFDNGLLLKATAVGTGHNLFKINQLGQNDIENLPGNSIYSGDIKFCTAITEIKYLSSSNQLLVATQDGLVVKIDATGEAGDNMFGLTFDCNTPAITNHTGNSWVGDALFTSPVVMAEMLNNDLFLSSYNGEIKVFNGAGGIGSNWANNNVRGNQDFNAPTSSMYYDAYYNQTFLSFKDGRLLKLNGTGGTGNYIFNVTETTRGFETRYPSEQPEEYFKGCMYFEGTSITSFNNIDGNVFIGMENGKLLKLAGYGTDGENMYRLGGNQNLQNLCENYYLIGKQDFPAIGAYRTGEDISETKMEPDIKIYPNPNTGTFKIALPSSESKYHVNGILTDITGRIVKTFEINLEEQSQIYSVDASNLSNGTYFLNLSTPTNKKVLTVTINK